MKLYKYNQFIKESKEDIDSICKKYNIQDYIINEDGSIDVQSYANLTHLRLNKLPLKFRNVSLSFYCQNNYLTSLVGSPQSVGDNFHCHNNRLTSLKGCPQSVSRDFECDNNQLTSLEGCPQNVGGDFNCSYNKITDFKGFPEYFEGNFNFYGNPVQEILDLFRNHPKSIYWIMEHDVIQGNKVILQRLEEVAYELKMDLPENITLKNYEII